MGSRLLAAFGLWVAALLSSLVVVSLIAGQASADTRCTWDNVDAESPGFDGLTGLFAVSQKDVWAVGSSEPNGLRLHWDGHSFDVVPGPTFPGTLFDVDGVSASDVWAVGVEQTPFGRILTHTEHWDGSSWSAIPSPNPGQNYNYLYDVEAIAADDVWAVGYSTTLYNDWEALIEHYDGTSWSVMPAPEGWGSVAAVSALSSDDVWAIGAPRVLNSQQRDTLIAHWDGTGWTSVPSPNGSRSYNELRDIEFVSPTDGWAVGYSATNGLGAAIDPLMLHWDGISWSYVPAAGLDTFTAILGVSVLPSGGAWVVGYSYHTDTFDAIRKGVVGYWDGSSWTLNPPAPSVLESQRLSDVVAFAPKRVWAVGDEWRSTGDPPYDSKTVVQRCSPGHGARTLQTPSPTPNPSETARPG